MWCRGGCFLHLTFQNRRECEIWANHHLTPSYTRLQRMGTLAYTLGVGHLFKYQMIEMHFHTNSFNASENCTLQKWGTLLVKTVFTCFSHFFSQSLSFDHLFWNSLFHSTWKDAFSQSLSFDHLCDTAHSITQGRIHQTCGWQVSKDIFLSFYHPMEGFNAEWCVFG